MLDVKNVIFEGIAYTVMGIVVVFAMLLIIMYVIKAMQLFSKTNEKPSVKAEEKPVVEAPQEPQKAQSDSTELIAVITAAIAAAMGKSSSGFIVKSYKKLSGDEWNKTGRREVLDNRF